MPVRDETHFATPGEPRCLEARFDSSDVFAREYSQNISQGGVFIETEDPFELRELVVVEFVLTFIDARVQLEGEVVNVRPPGIAGAPGGVAVQLLAQAADLRARLGPLAATSQAASESDLDLRSTRRKRTRALARVGDGEHVVRTLDLSTGGALLEMAGELPPIGETVEVSLRHPVTGDEYTIEGTVVRHHEREGELRGVGVRFDTDVMEQLGVERFVEDVQAAAHARSLGGIRGPIDQLGLASLLQMFGVSAPQGTLRVIRGNVEGSVGFDGGLLRHARVGEVTGCKALARLLRWRDGSFEFHAHLEEGEPEESPIPLDGAIFEAVHQIDELARVELPSSVTHAGLRVDRARLASEPGRLEKVEEAVVDLVAAKFPIWRVLDVIPVSDAEIHTALRALLERGVLVSDAPAQGA